jgi:serine/threonine-protein kinase
MRDEDSPSDQTTVIPRRTSNEQEQSTSTELRFEGWDRYKVLEFLGKGSTSKVYKAIDLALNRKVALKFILEGDSDTEKRFIREARAQAQIEHTNVCKIHEVGTYSGKYFIAMQLIEGEILSTASQKMSLEQKVLSIQQIAEALHTAHKMGIIHRDIKPSNIMVEKTDAGWHPYVLDFGLAREIAMEGLTVTGMVLGTPAFMPPEQAWGESQKLDRRSDVYSLGGTLYYVLTNKPPYEGNSMEVILKLSQEDPTPVRKIAPEIPRDLETIVMKCMDRNPDRRYDSAKAFSEDLERYLNGDSIQARPATVAYRVKRKIQKHKTAAALLAISTFLVLVLGGIGIYSWWRAAQQVRIAKEFMQLAENMEWRMRVARMAPLHNLSEDREQVNRKMQSILQRIQEAGSLAEGPGNYAYGRGLMELSRLDEAQKYLQKAWDAGYRTPENAYALGITLGHQYQQELEAAQRAENLSGKKSTIKDIEAKYRDRILAYLSQSQGSEPEVRDYIEGLIKFYEKKYPEAIEKARSAQKLWWLYEAGKLEGDVYMALGIEQFDRANYEAALKHYSDAGNSFLRAMQIARSEPALYESDCWKWLEILKVESYRAGNMKEPMDKGLAACDLALEVDPNSAIAYGRKAQISWRWSEDLYYRGEYSEESLNNAIQFAQSAVERKKNDSYAHFELGNSYHMKMLVDLSSGRDPKMYGTKSIEHFNTAAKLKPYSSTYNNLAIVYVDLAQYDVQHFQDPRSKLELGIQNSKKAAELLPNSVAALNTLGNAHIILSDFQIKRGIDPEETLNRAIDALTKAHYANPKHPAVFLNLATAYVNQATSGLHRGRDPNNPSDRAIENSQRALELGGDGYATVYSIMGAALLTKAKYKIYQGQEPGELKRPIEYAKKTLESGSNEGSLAYNVLLDSYFTSADYNLNRGKDPSQILSDARDVAQKAISEFPDSDLSVQAAQIEVLAAQWDLRSGRSPEKNLEKASQLIEQSLKANSKNALALAVLAEIHEAQATWFQRQNKPLDAVISDGIITCKKALDLNPSLAETAATLGKLQWIQAQTETDSQKRSESLRIAREAVQKAITLNTNLKMKYEQLLSQMK